MFKILFSVVILCSLSFAEPAAETKDHKPGETPPDTTRSESDQPVLRKKELKKLVDYSGIDQNYLIEKFIQTIPTAVSKAMAKPPDYAELSKEVNTFASWLNDDQLRNVIEDTAKTMDAEKERGNKRDDRYMMFLKGLNWVSKVKLGRDTNSEDEEKFAKIAKTDSDALEAQKAALRTKMKLAIEQPDGQDAKDLRNEVNGDAVMSFIRTQLHSKDAEDRKLAEDLAAALGYDAKNANGDKFVDLVDRASGNTAKVFMPKGQENLKGFLDSLHGQGVLNNRRFSPNNEPLGEKVKPWSYDLSTKSAIAKLPNGVQDKQFANNAAPIQGAGAFQLTSRKASGSVAKTQSLPKSSSSGTASKGSAPIGLSKCIACHARQAKKTDLTAADVRNRENEGMPPNATDIPANELAELDAWAKNN